MGKVFIDVAEVQQGAKWIDARFDLADLEKGQALYEESHVAGAVYWHLERDLSDMSSNEGRHPMPTQNAIQQLLERSGLTQNDLIYIYDQGAAPFAARAWAILQYAGFTNMFIVNGGFAALQQSDITFTSEATDIEPSTLTLDWQTQHVLTSKDVERIVAGEERATLLDARANARYKGEMEPIDSVAGHIPTAKNFDWEQLKRDGQLHYSAQLAKKVAKDEPVVVYCGSGVTASPVYAVLQDAGYTNARIYMGSYSDWIREHAIETGENE